MEVVIDAYFDKLFEGMERDYLVSRHKRKLLVKYFSDVIISVSEAENLETRDVCERIVLSALRYHNIAMSENGSICLLGKFHNILYVAAKLCYDWSLANNEIVVRLLNDIFYCEKTFERIFIGAIFGIRVTHFLSGWKCDFEDREENIRALTYFLDHAITGRLWYVTSFSSVKCRFIDVAMESYGRILPVKAAVQQGAPDILLILLRYGASMIPDNSTPSPFEILLAKLNEYDIDNDVKPIIPQNFLACLRILLRSITVAYVRTPEHIANKFDILRVPLYEQHPNLIKGKLIPPERSGLTPPELRHLCRCTIRQALFDNWALPHGIKSLDIPESLHSYLDLLHD